MRQQHPFTPTQGTSTVNQRLVLRTALVHYHQVVEGIVNPESMSIESIIKYATRLNQDAIYCQSMSGNRQAALWAQLATALLSKLSTITKVDIWDCFGKQLQNMWHQESVIMEALLNVWFETEENINNSMVLSTIKSQGSVVTDETLLIVDMLNVSGMGITFRKDTLHVHGHHTTTTISLTNNNHTEETDQEQTGEVVVDSNVDTLVALTKRAIALRGRDIHEVDSELYHQIRAFDYTKVCDPKSPRTVHLIVYFCIQVLRVSSPWNQFHEAMALILSYLPRYIIDSITKFTFKSQLSNELKLKGGKQQKTDAASVIVDALDNLGITSVTEKGIITYTFPTPSV